MKNIGLSPSDEEFIRRTVVRPLEEQGAQVFVFGSRARGDWRKFSDLDLMVEAPVNLRPTISAIQEQVVESNLPIKVDLAFYDDFADEYRDQYQKEKVRFPKDS